MPTQIMTLETILDSLRTAGERMNDLSSRLAIAATQEAPDLAQVNSLQTQLQTEVSRYNALKQSAAALRGEQQEQLPAQPTMTDAEQRTRRDILKSNEYARAFALVIRRGLTLDTARGLEETKVLFDALTIGGGSPAGSDGGFLVPEDVNHQIRELMREMSPLRQFFAVESVTAPTGWRVKDSAPSSGFSQVDEMGTVPSNDQPSFAKVSYALVKYGLILPVSNELFSDEVANLFAYLARWGAKKEVITENTLLLAALNDLAASATSVTAGQELKDLKHIMNVGLDPAIRKRASIITNQDGFDLLDSLEDLRGRPLIQPNPVDGTPRMLGGYRVADLSNAMIPSTTTGTGNDAVTNAPLFLGSGEEYATLFEREHMEIVSTNIGGTAFTTDSTQIRFIKRMGVSKFDTDAMKMAKVPV